MEILMSLANTKTFNILGEYIQMPKSLEERVSSKCVREPIDRIREITGTPPWIIFERIERDVGLHSTTLYRAYSGKQASVSLDVYEKIRGIVKKLKKGRYDFPLLRPKFRKPRIPKRVSSEECAGLVQGIVDKANIPKWRAYKLLACQLGIDSTTVYRICTRISRTLSRELDGKVREMAEDLKKKGLIFSVYQNIIQEDSAMVGSSLELDYAKRLYDKIIKRGKMSDNCGEHFIAKVARPDDLSCILAQLNNTNNQKNKKDALKEFINVLREVAETNYNPAKDYKIGDLFYFSDNGYGFVVDDGRANDVQRDTVLVEFVSGEKGRFRKNLHDDPYHRRNKSVFEMHVT